MMQAVAKAKEDESPIRLDVYQERMRRNLERFIKASGYSVTEVADLAGIPQANLARWVAGKSKIDPGALRPLAEALGRASIDDFDSLDPPRQRTRAELAEDEPMMSKARPGYSPTEQDIADFNEALRRVQSRREKKKPKSSR